MVGEFFGSPLDFEYPIGDKLYELAVMNLEDVDKLRKLYTDLIELVCTSKESNSTNIQMDYIFKMFLMVKDILSFSPYTHFYTQTLIDIIVKTYNTSVFRTDLLYKYKIGVFIENPKYYADERFEELEEDTYVTQTYLYQWTYKIGKISKKKHNEYMEYFETIRDLLINNFIEKKADLKERLELISKYSNNSIVRNLSNEERLYLYETKKVFDIYYVNLNPAHSIFLDTKFVTKYIYDKELSREERKLDIESLVQIIKERNLFAEEVYELDCCENQIRLELFKIIQNNFSINKCENCGRLFIPITTSRNPNQKGRNDQKYCNNLYQDTGKTCREIGALNKRKEKVQNSPILQEYNREYKRMYGLHYNHPKKFKEAKFNEWSKKAQKLRDRYSDEQIEDFRIELKKLSDKYYIV